MKFLLPLLLTVSLSAHAAKCISHRGQHSESIENSIGAIKGALELNADGIEIDIRHTKDGIAILMHDETLQRVVDHSQKDCLVSAKVSDLTFAQIQMCRLNDGQIIPTLEEALKLFANNETMVFIELKDKFSENTISAISQSDIAHNRIRFISFKTKFLRSARKIFPEIKLLRLSRVVPFFAFTRGMNVDYPLRQYTFFARLFGNETGVWAFDDKDPIHRMHQSKIDYITTDFIERCLNAK